jgi:hypothetical protein
LENLNKEFDMAETPLKTQRPSFFNAYEDWDKGVDTLTTTATAYGKIDGKNKEIYQAASMMELDVIMREQGYERHFMGKVYWPIRAAAKEGTSK